MDLFPVVYTREKVFRITEPSGTTRIESVNVPVRDDGGRIIELLYDVLARRVDVVVVSNSTLPVSRWAEREAYQQLYTQGLIDQLAFLQKTEIEDWPEIYERMGQMQQLQQALEQAQEEIQRLQGDAQTSQRELKGMDRKVEREKFKATKARADERVRKDAELFSQRASDRTSSAAELTTLINQLLSEPAAPSQSTANGARARS